MSICEKPVVKVLPPVRSEGNWWAIGGGPQIGFGKTMGDAIRDLSKKMRKS